MAEIMYIKNYDLDVILSTIIQVHGSLKESCIRIIKVYHYFEVIYIYEDWNKIRGIFATGFGFGCQTRAETHKRIPKTVRM